MNVSLVNRVRLLTVIALLGVFINVPSITVHADGPIEILSQSASGELGKEFTFKIVVKGTQGSIVVGKLFANYPGDIPYTYDVEPQDTGSTATIQYSWDLGNVDLPPWQVFLYHWEITDSVGNVLTTPQASGEISDNSHPWKKLTDGKVSVYYYGQSATFGKSLLSATQRGFRSVATATGHHPKSEIRVVIYNNQDDYCAYHLNNGCLQWAGGETDPGITVQYLDKRFDADNWGLFNITIPHELAHAFLHEWLGPKTISLPVWFDEGQAVNNQIEGTPEYLNQAIELAKADQLLRLKAIGTPSDIDPDDTQKVYDWYAQATSLVGYLFERWGRASLGKIVTEMVTGQSFAIAMKDVTGLTLDEYERKWRAWVGAPKLPTATPTSEPMQQSR